MNQTETKQNSSYFYDGSILLAEKVGSQIQKIYINDGQGIVGMVRPIYNESNTLTHYQRLYYLYDSLGSVSAVTGEHGLPLQNYTYSPFGTCLNVTNDPINNLQFVGRYGGYLDNDTGLTYFWHRWYDSKDGRWVSRDPVGIRGGINLYGYVKNRATIKYDPKGLFSVSGDCGCNRDKMERELNSICMYVDNFVTDDSLGSCIKERCNSGQVNCQNKNTSGSCDGGTLGYNNGLGPIRDSAINLCMDTKGIDKTFSSTAIHEWAHSCGWDHGDGKGIPGNPTDGSVSASGPWKLKKGACDR
jgi:RHS repeat-associated protein